MHTIIGKEEKAYLDCMKRHKDQGVHAHVNSPQEGFEYFESEDYLMKYGNSKPVLLERFTAGGLKGFIGMLNIFLKHMGKMMRTRGQGFVDVQPYLDELDTNGFIQGTSDTLTSSYPNASIWNELRQYAKEKWDIHIGFTEVPEELVFKGKAVLFKYALVCYQEMSEDKIKKAPELEAGSEVMRVYKELGFGVDDIANWLREKYGVKCQSNHPLGGLVNTSPLAAKAGLGWQGHNGLLITPEFGQRQRIAPIFIQDKLFEFTDNFEHKWIEQFCKTCRKCEKNCPSEAIYSEKIISIEHISGIEHTRTCIDRTKCFPYFNKTLGCSVCVKVCPFSSGGETYHKLKQVINKRAEMEVLYGE